MKKIYECEETGMQFVEIPYPDKPFLMSKFTVTQKQYKKFRGHNPSKSKGKDRPVTNVSHSNAKYFCNKSGFFLPTLDQWRFAAGDFPKENIEDYAWFEDNSKIKLHKVGRKKPNKYGLYDMYGNVWEWTSSWCNQEKDEKVITGGSFISNTDGLASSGSLKSSECHPAHGFRCAKFLK